jgi:hypothetical protein
MRILLYEIKKGKEAAHRAVASGDNDQSFFMYSSTTRLQSL